MCKRVMHVSRRNVRASRSKMTLWAFKPDCIMEDLRKTAGVFLDKCVWLLLTGVGLFLCPVGTKGIDNDNEKA